MWKIGTKAGMVLISSMIVVGCGGGGGGSDGTDSTQSPSTATSPSLEGTWVYASANHTTGTTCSLDIHGGYEERITVKFTGNIYEIKSETCLILRGNTGSFFMNDIGDGTFKTGDVFFNSGSYQYSTLDFETLDDARRPITIYSGYNVTSNQLRLTQTVGTNDGSTPDKRQTGTQYPQPVFTKL